MQISVIIPAFNSSSTLKQCLESVFNTNYPSYECILVDDGSTDSSLEIARQFPVKLTSTQNGPSGPAHARNVGVEAASGDILLFIDSDVTISPDTLEIVSRKFGNNPEIAAIFGSYDDQPGHRDFFSQYKNLYHHFIHQTGQQQASTFWSGCGAIRREVFLKAGGFDARKYPHPSIEDIDLGYRLKSMGYEITLEKEIQVKHLKRWSFFGLVKTDIFQRAVPWSQLILRDKKLPNDLNISSSQRISTILLLLSIPILAIFAFQQDLILLPLLIAFTILCTTCWHWENTEPFFMINSRKEPLLFGLIAVIYIFTLWTEQLPFLIPFIILLPLLIMGNWLSQASSNLRRFLYFSILVTISLAYVILLIGYPLLLWIPLVVIIFLIIILNRKMYLFFAQKRGLLFTLAALPMQLIYYLYSFTSFVAVGIMHYWNLLLHKSKTQVQKGSFSGPGRP